MDINSDEEILGNLPEQITAPPKSDKIIIPDNLPHGGVEGVKPVKLRELPPMPSDYRLKRTSHQKCAWWALPYGLYLYIKDRLDTVLGMAGVLALILVTARLGG